MYARIIKGDDVTIRLEKQDGSFLYIPEDENNRHYQKYLAWLNDEEANNQPEVIEV